MPLSVRRVLATTERWDVAGARVAIFAAVFARASGRELQVISLDDAAAAGIADDLAWLGIELHGDPIDARAGERRGAEHVRDLVARGAARDAGGVVVLPAGAGAIHLFDDADGALDIDAGTLGDTVLIHSDGALDPIVRTALDTASLDVEVVLRERRALDATARGVAVLAALGLRVPRYAFVGTLVGDAPRDELPTLAQLRRNGYDPAVVVTHLALRGWTPPVKRADWTWPQLSEAFSLAAVTPLDVPFARAELRARNRHLLHALGDTEFAVRVTAAMQDAGFLESPVPAAATRWIATFVDAYGPDCATVGEALAFVADLRAEATLVPALELEKLRNRQVVFYLDAVGQYVDAHAELRGLPLDRDLPAIADEFGIAPSDAFAAVRMALTGKRDGPPLESIFVLLGHDRILIRIGAISSHLLHGRGLEPIKFGPGGVPFETITPVRPPGR